MLVLLMGVIYKVHHWDGLTRHDMHTKFQKDWFGQSSNIRGITSTVSDNTMLVLLTKGIYDARLSDYIR
jgi:hypothetical protein